MAWTRAVSVTLTAPVSSVQASVKRTVTRVHQIARRAPAEPTPVHDIGLVEERQAGCHVVGPDQLQLPEPGAAVDEERGVDVIEHAADELLDRAVLLPDQREPEALGVEGVGRGRETRSDLGTGIAETPVAVGQAFADDMGRVHVRAVAEGTAQRGDQRLAVAGRDDRHAIDGRVVDPRGGTGVGERDVEAEDVGGRQRANDRKRRIDR